ncbi:glycosyltransferase [Phormidium sp. CLA17]|uniref:glycosyltransferase n=1 Tax=Leptolyngbya sp. Cla-17 TaxID=2803751 RepID=UPI00149301D6|nr:glycosyltransferase [Leptolyngbya sp. Cla-17]MBM0743236.1 glycosyltransferase [Leptolyngbya sp. Cla-17]
MTLSFSVIVPVYNCQDSVVKTLQSIEQSIQYFCQTSPMVAEIMAEVIVVNDASSDRTLELATQWMQTNPSRFIVVNHQTSLGLAIARNTGLKYAKGELIFFCDPNSFFSLPHVSACILCLHQPNQPPAQQLGEVTLDVKLIQENQYQISVPPYALDAVQTGIRTGKASASVMSLENHNLSNLCVKRECHEFLEGFLDLPPLHENGQEVVAYHQWLRQFFLVGKLAVETVESAEPISRSPGMIELVQTGPNAVMIPKSAAIEVSNAHAIEVHSQRLLQRAIAFNKQKQARLFQIYRTYVSTTSLEDHAVSWEAARYLFQAVQEAKPKRILDLGSGYSSLIFRTYQATLAPETTVVSVDDDAEWLEKTKAFLQANDISTEHCITWKDFLNAYADQSYDFILYDMGNMYTRAENLTKIVDVMEPTGSLIIDDVHFSFYAMVVFEVIGNYRLRLQSLKRETLDKYGRYAVKATYT